jgi:hypothetical protein
MSLPRLVRGESAAECGIKSTRKLGLSHQSESSPKHFDDEQEQVRRLLTKLLSLQTN